MNAPTATPRPCLRYGPDRVTRPRAPRRTPRPLFGPWLDVAAALARAPLSRAQLRERLGWGAHRVNQTLHLMARSGLITETAAVALTPTGRRRIPDARLAERTRT